MLNPLSFISASRIFKYGCFFKIFPFVWDPVSFKLKPLTGRKLWISTLFVLSICARSVFLAVSIFRNKKALLKDSNPSSLLLHCLWLVVFSIGSILTVHTFVRRRELASLVNHVFQLLRELQNEYIDPNVPIKPTGSEMYLRVCLLNACTCPLFVPMFFFEDPLNPRYYSTLLATNARQLHWSFKIVIPIWESIDGITIAISFFFYAAIFICYWCGTVSWLGQMRFSRGHKSHEAITPEAAIRLRRNVRKIYRSLQLLNQDFNNCCRQYIIPVLESLLVVCPVLGANSLISLHSGLPLGIRTCFSMMVLVCLVIATLVFPLGAKLNTRAKSLLKSLHMDSARTISKKMVKSMRPIRIEIGYYSFIQRTTALKIVARIVYWTMKSLLLNRH